MPSAKRYKFPGSQFRVQIGFLATKAITAVTNDDPANVSSVAHGLEDGTPVKVAGVVGMTELNGNLYVVQEGATANDLDLIGVDSTDYTAYISDGTLAPADMSPFCELQNFNQQDGAADEYEATTICSKAKEFEVGLSDPGTMQLDYLAALNSPIQVAMRAAKRSGEILAFDLLFPKDGGRVVALGSVQSQNLTGGNGGLWQGSATIRLTGEIYVFEGGVA